MSREYRLVIVLKLQKKEKKKRVIVIVETKKNIKEYGNKIVFSSDV
jgi:hypothetical protein